MNFPKLLAKKLEGDLTEVNTYDNIISFNSDVEVYISTSHPNYTYIVGLLNGVNDFDVISRVTPILHYGEFEVFTEISEELSKDRESTIQLIIDGSETELSIPSSEREVISKSDEELLDIIYNHIQTILDI